MVTCVEDKVIQGYPKLISKLSISINRVTIIGEGCNMRTDDANNNNNFWYIYFVKPFSFFRLALCSDCPHGESGTNRNFNQ